MNELARSRNMTSMALPRPGVQERILLHLRDYVDYSERVEVPFALSQMGIANAVSIARSNVPRAISGMREQGLLLNAKRMLLVFQEKERHIF